MCFCCCLPCSPVQRDQAQVAVTTFWCIQSESSRFWKSARMQIRAPVVKREELCFFFLFAHWKTHAAKSTGFNAVACNLPPLLRLFIQVMVGQQCPRAQDQRQLAPSQFMETFYFFNEPIFSVRSASEQLVVPHTAHAYQTAFPSCLWGNRGPKWAKLSHIESWLCQQAQCAHAQGKYAAQYLYYSPCQAGALVTQDNQRFVGCWSRQFIPEFTICLAETWLWGGGTTLTQHFIAATVAPLLISTSLRRSLADFCMIASWNLSCTSIATVATGTSQDANQDALDGRRQEDVGVLVLTTSCPVKLSSLLTEHSLV